MRNYGVPALEERQEIIKVRLGRGYGLSVFDIMKSENWSKTCAYNALKSMRLVRKKDNRIFYYSLPVNERIKKITPGEKLKCILLFYSVTERRCAVWQ